MAKIGERDRGFEYKNKKRSQLQQFSINLTTEINHQIKSRQGFCGLHT
jgi:hypothetical protein